MAPKRPARKRSAKQQPEPEVQVDKGPNNDASVDEEPTDVGHGLPPEELAAQEHAARVEHNQRTGGGDVHEGELQAQRDEHNRRTAGVAAEK